jgi:hypothetical protein
MMKKQILLIFGLLLSNFLYSQTIPVGTYEAKISGWARGDTNHHCGEAFVNLEFQSGAVRFVTISYSENSASQNFANSYFFKANNIPNSIYFSASRQIKESCNGDRPNNQGRIYSNDYVFRSLDYSFEFRNMNNVNSDGSGLWNSSGNILICPKLTILDNSNGVTRFNYFEVDDQNSIVIQSHTDFLPTEYNWEYIDPLLGGGWIPFTDTQTRIYNGLSSLTLTLADINPLNVDRRNFYGRTLSIRQVGIRQASCNSKSDPIKYSLVKTPPLLVSTTPKSTQCAYSEDGEVQFALNRVLENEETFGFDLSKLDPLNPVLNTYIPVVIAPTQIISIGKLCTLIKLAPGVYKGNYKTKFPNLLNDFSLKSQPVDISFTIGSSPALKYKARMAQPKCATDGAEIVINAISGGTPPYSYTIKGTIVKPDKTTTDFEITKEFTNSAGTPNADHGQPNGDYIIPLDPELNGPVSIKVIDKNKCIDGNKTAP